MQYQHQRQQEQQGQQPQLCHHRVCTHTHKAQPQQPRLHHSTTNLSTPTSPTLLVPAACRFPVRGAQSTSLNPQTPQAWSQQWALTRRQKVPRASRVCLRWVWTECSSRRRKTLASCAQHPRPTRAFRTCRLARGGCFWIALTPDCHLCSTRSLPQQTNRCRMIGHWCVARVQSCETTPSNGLRVTCTRVCVHACVCVCQSSLTLAVTPGPQVLVVQTCALGSISTRSPSHARSMLAHRLRRTRPRRGCRGSVGA